jgi:hypothetical protein
MGNVRIPLIVTPSDLSIFASITRHAKCIPTPEFYPIESISSQYYYLMYFYLNYLAWKSKFFVPYYVRSYPARLGLPYFSLSPRKRYDVRGKLLGIKCVLISTSTCNLSPSSKHSDTYYHIHTYSSLRIKCPIFSPDFNQTRIFSTDFNKAPQYQISRKSVHLVSSCYKRTNGQARRR